MRSGEAIEGRDVVVVELGVEPHDLSEFPGRVDGAGVVPVDERDGEPVSGDDVPRSEVAVSDDRHRTGQSTGEPRSPAWPLRFERRRDVVEFSKSTSDLPKRFVRPCEWVRADAFYKRQLLSAIRRESAVDRPWSGAEALVGEVLEERDHGR